MDFIGSIGYLIIQFIMKKLHSKFILYSLVLFCVWSCNSSKTETKLSFPSDKNATSATAELYSGLKTKLELGIMLGHQDDLAYGNKWYGEPGRSDVKSVCGDYPAVFGWNVGNVEMGGKLNSDSVSFTDIRAYIKQVQKMGGISTLNWNVRNPVSDNTVGNSNTVTLILSDKTIQKQYVAYLDYLAAFLNTLKNEEGNLIPIILQPFQDYNIPGKYWWNVQLCSPDDFRNLWAFTVNYLQEKKNIHHVLYAYSFFANQATDALNSYYPGNKYVDIVGVSYNFLQDNDPEGAVYKQTLSKNLAAIVQFAEKNHKIAALTNTGMEGIKIPNYFSKYVYPVISHYKLSYIMFGRNSWNDENKYFIPVPGHPASDDFNIFAKSPKILTCSKISD